MGKGKPKLFVCYGCGTNFEAMAKKDGKPYCTHDCYLDNRYGKGRPAKTKRYPMTKIYIKQCINCNIYIVAKVKHQIRCAHCRYLNNIALANQREHELRIPHRKLGDKITRKQLHERDGGRCYICKQKTVLKNKGKKRNKNLSTIDHVVPVSKGGTHTWDNVRNCCWQCNIVKGSNTLDNYQEVMIYE
jgi:5-methylcytosine-specific restriction endonuclease McrA